MTDLHVPETRGLDSEDAMKVLRRVHFGRLARASLDRLREADGLTFARALGFQMVLSALPGLIALTAVAVWTGNESLRTGVEGALASFSPGPTGDVLMEAVGQADGRGSGDVIAMAAGGVAALTAGIQAMVQVMKGSNRIYGILDDRPLGRRYAVATGLALSAGVLFVAAFVLIAAGDTIGNLVGDESVWLWLRWPVGAIAASVAVAALYELAPHRRQPSLSWLIVGGLLATGLWLVFSVGLSLYLSASSTFGDLYGPLAGFIGLLLWAQFSGFALLGGMAFAAQLEAERLGATGPPGRHSSR